MRLAINFQHVDPSKGGAETYVADLARGLVRRGHEVDLYAESWVEEALPAEVRRVHVPAEGPSRRARIWSFGHNSEIALRSKHYDCSIGLINTWAHDVLIPQGGVHQASLDHNARRFPAGWRREAYRLAKVCNPKFALYRAIEQRQYGEEGSPWVVAVSHMVRGHLETYHHVDPRRVRVIPNAIDAGRLEVDDPAAVRRAFRAEHGLADDDLVALFVGHNFRLKGLGPLLKALRLRQERNPSGRPVHVLVCGGGRMGPFRRLVRKYRLAATVHLVGYVPDVRHAYHASDLFVLPTYYDPCSLVVFEALACGLPVVTTSFNGAGELITPGVEGFVIPEPDSLDELADALDVLANDSVRRAMSVNAARLGRAQSFDVHVDRLIGLFTEVAQARQTYRPSRRTAGVLV